MAPEPTQRRTAEEMDITLHSPDSTWPRSTCTTVLPAVNAFSLANAFLGQLITYVVGGNRTVVSTIAGVYRSCGPSTVPQILRYLSVDTELREHLVKDLTDWVRGIRRPSSPTLTTRLTGPGASSNVPSKYEEKERMLNSESVQNSQSDVSSKYGRTYDRGDITWLNLEGRGMVQDTWFHQQDLRA
ncbi:hypothetical protein VTJ49DRAFT_4076 [Mycothermus thermophilus]|uniref:Uncharacterized protein n=1 Tax=Humicola insolens TaxID=85995 RepID=A0ABR3V693_HUMIN